MSTDINHEKFHESVSLLAWGLNEELLVEEFLMNCLQIMDACVDDFEIIFVDDGSTDKTAQIACEVAKKDSRVRVLFNEKNLNVALSCRKAIKHATKKYLFWQTVDWSYDISRLPEFLQLLKSYDVVQGVRVPTDGSLKNVFSVLTSTSRRSDNQLKGVISVVNYLVIRLLYGVPLSDYQNVTFYPTKLVQSLNLTGTTSFLNPELLIRTHYSGVDIAEVYLPFIARTVGEAKGTRFRSVLKSVFDILKNWIKWGLFMRLKALPFCNSNRRGQIFYRVA